MGGAGLQCRTPEDEVCGPEVDSEGPSSGVITLPEVVIEGRVPAGTATDGGEAIEVDDAVVQQLVDDALQLGAAQWPESPPDAAQAAWYDVLTRRNRAPQDVNLAAAEHYLYARYAALQDGAASGVGMAVLAAGYDAVKAVAFGLGVEDWLSTDGTTPSRPTVGSTRWGMAGAVDGISGD